MQHDFTIGQCALILIACVGSFLIGTIDSEAKSNEIPKEKAIRAYNGEMGDGPVAEDLELDEEELKRD